jgi:hypothetical protein
MPGPVYFPIGPTVYVLANVTPGTANVAVTTGAYPGPVFLKIDNPSNANTDVFFNYGTSNTTTATIANATSTGSGVCIQHSGTEFIQVGTANKTPVKIYIAAATIANTVSVYVTPVQIIGPN